MKKIKLFIYTILCFFIFITQTFAQALDTETLSYIDSLVNSHYPENSPGLSLVIAKDGLPLYIKAYGKADLENNVPLKTENALAIGSMTKQFTAVAILKLVDEGKLRLTDDVKKIIPEYNTHGRTITIENLLTHTSGIPSFTEKNDFGTLMQKKMDKTDIVKSFADDELLFEPGTDFSYSNSAYFLLGLIIEKVSGMSYQDYIQQNIFDKLLMNQSGFGRNENNFKMQAVGYEASDKGKFKKATYFDWSWPYSAGNIMSSTRDLLLWDEALYSDKIVSRELLKKAWTPYELSDKVSANYGYGWNVTSLGGYIIIKHGGAISGFLSDAIRVPEKHLYIAALSNFTGKSPEDVTNKILMKLLDIKDDNPQSIPLDKASFSEYEGSYEMSRNGGRVLKNYGGEKQYRFIFSEGDNLMMQRSGGGKYSLIPYAKDKFYIDGSTKRFEFIRDNSGSTVAMDVTDYPVTFGPSDYNKKVNVPMPKEKIEVNVPVEILKKYEGEYELQPGFNLKMFVEDGLFYAQATGQQKIQLFAESENKFFMKVVDAQVEFVPDPDGAVNKLIFTQGQRFECKRIN